MTREDESKVRDLIKGAIDKEINKQNDEFEAKIVKKIKESEKSQKGEFMIALKKEIDSLGNKFLTKQQVKDLMVKALVRQHRFMWEKSKFITSYFNDL